MKRTTLALALSLAAALPAAAQDSLSNTWIEGNYINVDGDADGHGIRGSFEFGDSNFYGLAGYSRIGIDDTPFKLDGSELGVGYAHPMNDGLDLFAEAAYVDTEAAGFVTTDGTGIINTEGYRTSVGLRSALTDKLEGSVRANYVDLDEVGDDFSGTLGAMYKFTPTWGLTGDVTFGDDAETYQLGVRASF